MLQLIFAALGLAAAAAACILGKDEMYLRQLEAKKRSTRTLCFTRTARAARP